uniref:adenylate kinase n=1 Tax=Ananas comosus var. bracteatus TaxID=296719 RepID=A0A6V7QUZ1_ANACO
MAAAKPSPILASPRSHKPTTSLSSPHSFVASNASLWHEHKHLKRISVGLKWNAPSKSTSRASPVVAEAKPAPLRIMISGAPASGKGTQCELIKKRMNSDMQFGLVHISAGDLLRAEIAAGTDNGKRAKEYMEKGKLVPDEIVVLMVKERLMQPDAEENGWLLDGYPRSLSQTMALEDLGIRPDLFILLEVSDEILIERVVGRRLDPVTGRIYHLKYSPPENEEIASRLTQRFDDTEEKVRLRLQTHYQNVDSVLSIYDDIIYKVNGNARKEDVFAEIDKALSSILEKREKMDSASIAAGLAH